MSSIKATLGVQWSPNPTLYEEGDKNDENRKKAGELCLDITKLSVILWGHLTEKDLTLDTQVAEGQVVTEDALQRALTEGVQKLKIPEARVQEIREQLEEHGLEGLFLPETGDLEFRWDTIPYAEGAGKYVKNIFTCDIECVHGYALTTETGIVQLQRQGDTTLYAELQATLTYDLRKQDPVAILRVNPKTGV